MIKRSQAIKIYKKLRQNFFSVANLFFLNPINTYFLQKIALYGYGGDKCLKKGFLPLPVHFYSPVPDIDNLIERKIWDKKNNLTGIDFKIKDQLSLLKTLGEKYNQECQWSLEPTNNLADYHIDNPSFSYSCAAILYSMVRQYQPHRIIEIGSGNSSKVIYQAIKKSKTKTNYTIIDPYPGKYIRKKAIKYTKLIKNNVELLDPKIFEELGLNDILFIDSSHIVKIGNDVNYLYLDILPRLKSGVIVHIHDISIPYEYPKVYIINEDSRQLWTEQYILQAFLSCNSDYEILLAMSYIMKKHLPEFRRAFPNFNPKIHLLTSGSFWIRRKAKT